MSLKDILRQYSVPMAPEGHHHRTSRFPVQVDCPNCSPGTRKYRLGLSNTNAVCWVCGRIGSTANALAALCGRPVAEIRQLTRDLSPDAVVNVPRGRLVSPNGIGPLDTCHRDYLMERGYDPDELVRLWGLKGIGLASRLAWRIWIPFQLEFETVSWLTRAIAGDARYRSAMAEEEAVDHRDLLYGEDYCCHAIAIHEGPTDVWAVGPGAVATCGIGYRRSQVLRMAKYPTRLVCFNSEPAAQKRAQKLCRELAVFPGETINLQYTHKDAAESMVKCPSDIEHVRKLLGRS